MSTKTRPRKLAPAPPEAGFSLIEVVISSVVLLFIALGIIPIFTMAIQSNIQGQDSTKVANFARIRLEEATQLPSDHPLLQITAGTQRLFCESYDEQTDIWTVFDCATWPTPPAGSEYLRRTTIEQYQYLPFNDAMIAGTPLPALDSTAPASTIHIKQIIVEIQSTRTGGVFGSGKSVTVRGFKAV